LLSHSRWSSRTIQLVLKSRVAAEHVQYNFSPSLNALYRVCRRTHQGADVRYEGPAASMQEVHQQSPCNPSGTDQNWPTEGPGIRQRRQLPSGTQLEGVAVTALVVFGPPFPTLVLSPDRDWNWIPITLPLFTLPYPPSRRVFEVALRTRHRHRVVRAPGRLLDVFQQCPTLRTGTWNHHPRIRF